MIECQKKPERELKRLGVGGNVEETGRSVSNLKFLFICQWILEGRAYYGESSVKELKLATVRVTNRMEAGRRPWATCCTAYYLQRNQISLCRPSDYGDHVSQVVFGHWLCLEALAYTL